MHLIPDLELLKIPGNPHQVHKIRVPYEKWAIEHGFSQISPESFLAKLLSLFLNLSLYLRYVYRRSSREMRGRFR